MNPLRYDFFGFMKPRTLYNRANIVYNKKIIPRDIKAVREWSKQRRRWRKMSGYDPADFDPNFTSFLSTEKIKKMLNTLNEIANSHRFSREKIPDEEKKEYIKKCKEYSLFKSNQWRKIFNHYRQNMNSETEMLYSCTSLPATLCEEIFDYENSENVGPKLDDNINKYYDPKIFIPSPYEKPRFEKEIKKDSYLPNGVPRGFRRARESYVKYFEYSDDKEYLEYHSSFLYANQYLDILPDEMYVSLRASYNLNKFEKIKNENFDSGKILEIDFDNKNKPNF